MGGVDDDGAPSSGPSPQNQPPSQSVGAIREQRVADMIGGKVSGEKIQVKGIGSTDIDVIGPNGELVGVGGYSKVHDKGGLGQELLCLIAVGKQRGVKVLYYFEEGTPASVIQYTTEKLGEENVFIFPK